MDKVTGARPALNPAVEKLKQELLIAGYSAKTIKMYAFYAQSFLDFANKPAGEITREDIVGYLVKMKQGRNVSNATLSLIHSSLKFLFNNYLHKKIVDDIKVAKKAKKLPVILSKDEVKSLIRAVRPGRNRLIVEFLYSSGCRVSEAVKLKTEHINLKEGTGRVAGGKGNKDRMIILSKEWIKDINKYLKKKRVQSQFVFSKKNGKPLSTDTVQRIIRAATQKAGIGKQVTPHSLRHAYATHLLEAGENIRKIQELLGHSSLSTTQIYTKVSTQQLKKVKSPLDFAFQS